MSQDRSVSEVTGCGLDNRGSIPSKGRNFFFSSPLPYRPCCPLSLLLMDLGFDANQLNMLRCIDLLLSGDSVNSSRLLGDTRNIELCFMHSAPGLLLRNRCKHATITMETGCFCEVRAEML
jgi:hypothetical protein